MLKIDERNCNQNRDKNPIPDDQDVAEAEFDLGCEKKQRGQ